MELFRETWRAGNAEPGSRGWESRRDLVQLPGKRVQQQTQTAVLAIPRETLTPLSDAAQVEAELSLMETVTNVLSWY